MSWSYSSSSLALTNWTLTSPHSTSISPLPYQRLLLLLLLHASPAILLQLLPLPVPVPSTPRQPRLLPVLLQQQPSIHSISQKTKRRQRSVIVSKASIHPSNFAATQFHQWPMNSIKPISSSTFPSSQYYQTHPWVKICPQFFLKAWYLQHEQAWRKLGLIQHDFFRSGRSVKNVIVERNLLHILSHFIFLEHLVLSFWNN